MIAIAAVMFRLLFGDSNPLMLPKIGSVPIQFAARMKRNAVIMTGANAVPSLTGRLHVISPSAPRRSTSMKFWRPRGTSCMLRVARIETITRTAITIQALKMCSLISSGPMWKKTCDCEADCRAPASSSAAATAIMTICERLHASTPDLEPCAPLARRAVSLRSW